MLLIYGVLLNVGGMLLIFSGAFWYCRYCASAMISVWFLDTPLASMYMIFKGPFGFALTAFHFLCQYFNMCPSFDCR
jgi:hypothetical protein